MEADQLGRLRDILEAARLIAVYVKNIAEADFRANTEKQDTVTLARKRSGRGNRR